jgi:hypothetical protein
LLAKEKEDAKVGIIYWVQVLHPTISWEPIAVALPLEFSQSAEVDGLPSLVSELVSGLFLPDRGLTLFPTGKGSCVKFTVSVVSQHQGLWEVL